MSTTDVERLHQLDERQLRALDVLAAGGTHAKAAAAAGVHRVTVTKWSNSHLGFQAERNRRRQEMNAVLVDKAAQIDAAVLDQMLKMVLAGKPSAISLWLHQRGIASIRADAAAPITPAGVLHELVEQRQKEQIAESDRKGMAVIFDDMHDDGGAAPIDVKAVQREIETELIADLDELETAQPDSDNTGDEKGS